MGLNDKTTCIKIQEDISTEFNAYETLPVYRYLDRIYACNQGNDSAIEEFEKCLWDILIISRKSQIKL